MHGKLAVAGILLVFAPALALAESLPKGAGDSAQLLQTALSQIQTRAKQAANTRFAYQVQVDNAAPESLHYVIAYDPAEPEAQQWRILAPLDHESDAYKAAEKQVGASEKTPRKKTPDEALVVTRLPGNDLSKMHYLRTENGYAIYSFDVAASGMLGGKAGDDDKEDGSSEMDMGAMAKYMSGEFGIIPHSGQLAWLRLYAPESFKPVPVAKINDFSMMFTVKPAWKDGPLVIADQHIQLSGSALFKKFAQDTQIRMRDFKPVAQGE